MVKAPHVSIAAKDIPVCQQWPDKHLPCLLDVAEEMTYRPGQVIVAPGDPGSFVYVVVKGAARMVISSPKPSGTLSAVLRILGPGDLFGLAQVLDDQPYMSGLEAISDAKVLVATRASFLAELEDHPETARHLLDQLAALARKSQEWLLSEL